MNPKRIRLATAICPVGALALLSWNREGSGRADPFLANFQSGKSGLPVSSGGASPDASQTNVPDASPGNPLRPFAIVPPTDYESEEFIQRHGRGNEP
jgi:hypothetical protein